MFELLGLFAATYAIMLVGGVANRFARKIWNLDIARGLALAGAIALVATLALSFWPSPDHLRLRIAFYLSLAAGLLGVTASGARAARPGPDGHRPIYRMGAGVVAAIGVAGATLLLAFLLAWGDLHLQSPTVSYHPQ